MSAEALATAATAVDNVAAKYDEVVSRLDRFIYGSHTINVAPSGVSNPANPLNGEPFNLPSSALNWLRRHRMGGDALVNVDIAAGTYVDPELDLTHIDGWLLNIRGQNLTGAGFPNMPEISGTKSVDEALMRSRWPVIIETSGNGAILSGSALRLIEKILFVNTTGAAGTVGFEAGRNPNWGSGVNFGQHAATTVAMRDLCVIGFGSDGFRYRSSTIATVQNCLALHCGDNGHLVNDDAKLKGNSIKAIWCTDNALLIRDRAYCELSGNSDFRQSLNGIRIIGADLFINANNTVNVAENQNANVSATELARVRMRDITVTKFAANYTTFVGSGARIFMDGCINNTDPNVPVNTVQADGSIILESNPVVL